MSENWLNCEIEDGMFSDELVAAFATVNGEHVSFFVPKSSVRNNQLRVKVFEDDGQLWAVLPTEDRAIVPVTREAIAAA